MKTFRQSSFKQGQGSTNKLNRRDMMTAGLALGLTTVSLSGQTLNPTLGELHAGESGKEPTTDVRKNGLASIKGPSVLLNKKLEETSISGPTRDCGKAYGAIFADEIHGFMSLETKPSDSRLKLAAACLAYIRKFAPNSFYFLQGSAEGSGFSLELMTLFSLNEEIYHDALANAPKQPSESNEHCTAFVISRTRSTDGRTIVAQNWDMAPEHFPWVGLLRLRCDGKPATLTFHHPGLWSGCGINSEGLAHMWTGSGYYPPQTTVPGVPSYILISELLTMKSVAEVVNFLQETPNAGCYIFFLGDAMGKTAVVEAMPGRRPVIDYSPVNCRASQYESPDLIEASRQNLDDPHAASSKERAEKAHSILQSHDRRLSVDVIKDALTEGPIFREGFFRATTLASFIACCEERALWHCRGGLKPGQWIKTVL